MCLALGRCSTQLKQLNHESRLPRDCKLFGCYHTQAVVLCRFLCVGGRAQIKAIRVYNISRGLSRPATTWDEISGSDRIRATLFAFLIVLVMAREFYRQVHINRTRFFQNPKPRFSEDTEYSLSLWPKQEMCALIVITCLSVLCLIRRSAAIILVTSPTCCSIKVHYSARNARSSKLCPITISIRTFHHTRPLIIAKPCRRSLILYWA